MDRFQVYELDTRLFLRKVDFTFRMSGQILRECSR